MQLKLGIKKWHLVIAGVALAIYAAWNIAYPSGTWRYRMTVVVETPEGIKTGSAVREVYVRRYPQILPEVRSTTRVKGEAVAVDLGQRGILFGIMRGINGPDYNYRIVFDAFPFSRGGTTRQGIYHYRSLKNVKAVLKPELGQYPVFVRFRDLNDPKTVEKVLEMEGDGTRMLSRYTVVADHTEEMFGIDVKIKEVTIEMTDDAVTKGIEKWLPWLPYFYNKRLDGNRFGYSKAKDPAANSLSSGSFSTEVTAHGR